MHLGEELSRQKKQQVEKKSPIVCERNRTVVIGLENGEQEKNDTRYVWRCGQGPDLWFNFMTIACWKLPFVAGIQLPRGNLRLEVRKPVFYYYSVVNLCVYFNEYLLFFIIWFIGCAGSSLLCGLFSSCSKWGLLSICGMLPSHYGGFCCCGAGAVCGAGALGHTGFSNCSTWAQLLQFLDSGAQAQ